MDVTYSHIYKSQPLQRILLTGISFRKSGKYIVAMAGPLLTSARKNARPSSNCGIQGGLTRIQATRDSRRDEDE